MAFLQVDQAGRDVYWSVFAVMAFASICFGYLTLRRPTNSLVVEHLHHYLTWAIVTIAMLAYYCMAANGGFTYVQVYHSGGQSRTIYYARYIDWALTTPLLLLDLILLGNLTVRHTFRIMFADLAMILCGLFGALFTGQYKWGWYALGCIFFFFIVYDLLFSVRAFVRARSAAAGGLYNGLAIYLILLWFGYPIVWGLAEGGNVISVDAEAALYGALDILAKAVFGTILLLSIGRVSGPIAMTGLNKGIGGTPAVAAQPGNGVSNNGVGPTVATGGLGGVPGTVPDNAAATNASNVV